MTDDTPHANIARQTRVNIAAVLEEIERFKQHLPKLLRELAKDEVNLPLIIGITPLPH